MGAVVWAWYCRDTEIRWVTLVEEVDVGGCRFVGSSRSRAGASDNAK